MLRQVAARYADTVVGAVQREYPNALRHVMQGPDDVPRPREVHPAFYGCFDWHSAVEMHWALVRMLRTVPEAFDSAGVRCVLRRHLTGEAMRTEAAYFAGNRGFERPYGWGWTLMLAHELATWDDEEGQRWAAHVRPLAETIAGLFTHWLPRAAYPNRDGMHGNSAFGLVRSLPFARLLEASGDGRLLTAIADAGERWYAGDTDYPAAWEPGGSDFLSPALTEAELMAGLLDRASFRQWFDAFLPGVAGGEPPSLFTPARVVDPTDGQGAHLHGLNLYRAFAFERVAEVLPAADPRVDLLCESAVRHGEVSLPAVCGSHWMVEHWLACYAVLLLS